MAAEPGSYDAQQTSYMFSGSESAREWQRLNEQNDGISRYLGGKLSFAPLDDPHKFLEMGAGTGEWAIQAALQYPDAEIVAVDMSPLPSRPLPPNIHFQQLNLLCEFPWEKEAFDVIHMRLLLYHMPHAANFIRRVIPLLKPGGWLLIEDCCIVRYTSSAGPAQQKRNEIIAAHMISKGLDPQIGVHLEHILQESESFLSVSTHQVTLPFMPLPDDPSIRGFAKTMKESIIRATTSSLSAEFVNAGMTPELQKAWKEEMEDSRYDPVYDFVFTWACKHP